MQMQVTAEREKLFFDLFKQMGELQTYVWINSMGFRKVRRHSDDMTPPDSPLIPDSMNSMTVEAPWYFRDSLTIT